MLFKKSVSYPLITLMLLVALLITALPAPSAQAQDSGLGVVDQVLIIVSRNLGIYPAPTRGQIESGNFNFNADIGFEYIGLDLRDEPLSCTAPELGPDEQIIGTVGYLVRVFVQDRTYEFRTNQTGTRLIRCRNGAEVDRDFGAIPNAGTTISGSEAARRVIQHLNGYLALDPPMTLEDVNEGLTEYYTGYSWNTRIFNSTALDCPARNGTYSEGDMFGYQVDFRVRFARYRYYVSGDGNTVVLCRYGRPDDSSINFFNAPATETETTTP